MSQTSTGPMASPLQLAGSVTYAPASQSKAAYQVGTVAYLVRRCAIIDGDSDGCTGAGAGL